MAENNVAKTKKTPQNTDFTPFDKEHVLRPLKLFIIVVPFGQANAIISRLNEFDIACSFVFNGEGSARYFVEDARTIADSRKQIILTLVREDKVEFVKRKLDERFSVSKAARGFAFSIKVTSVAGVSIYKFLTNTRKVTKVNKYGRK